MIRYPLSIEIYRDANGNKFVLQTRAYEKIFPESFTPRAPVDIDGLAVWLQSLTRDEPPRLVERRGAE